MQTRSRQDLRHAERCGRSFGRRQGIARGTIPDPGIPARTGKSMSSMEEENRKIYRQILQELGVKVPDPAPSTPGKTAPAGRQFGYHPYDSKEKPCPPSRPSTAWRRRIFRPQRNQDPSDGSANGSKSPNNPSSGNKIPRTGALRVAEILRSNSLRVAVRDIQRNGFPWVETWQPERRRMTGQPLSRKGANDIVQWFHGLTDSHQSAWRVFQHLINSSFLALAIYLAAGSLHPFLGNHDQEVRRFPQRTQASREFRRLFSELGRYRPSPGVHAPTSADDNPLGMRLWHRPR